jgi:AcrR family transcriptional regulator
MPAIVDHARRRAQLAETAAALVASGGAAAATIRAVALATGFSTKVVTHYFIDKRALLLTTYRHAADHSSTVAEASQSPDVADVGAFAVALLPIDPAVRRDWMVWFAFWGLAVTDPEFAQEQRTRVRRARERIAALMTTDYRFAGLPAPGRANAARRLLTTVVGVALQASFDPDDWPAARQTAAVEAALADLGGLSSL